MKRAVGILLVLGMCQAHAASNKPPVSDSAKWKEECGSCHVAYPPHLLSSDNWKSLMAGLDKHFGSNASLDSQDNKEILGFLLRHADSDKRSSADTLRISDTPWFNHEHRSIAAKEWAHPEVRSRSNCSACHGKVILGS